MSNLILADLDGDLTLDVEGTGMIRGGAFLGQDQEGHWVQSSLVLEDNGLSFLSPRVIVAPTIAVGPQIQIGIAQNFTNIVASQIVGPLGRLQDLVPR